MRKEVIVAIVLGIAFGAAIGFGVWRANSALNDSDEEVTSDTDVASAEATPTPSSSQITIEGYESGDVVTANPIRIAGVTIADARVIVSTEDEDYIILSNEKGEFETEVELVGGVNQIRIFVFSDDERYEDGLDLIFSSKFAEEEESEESAGEESSEEE